MHMEDKTDELTPRSSPSPCPHILKASDARAKSALSFCNLIDA